MRPCTFAIVLLAGAPAAAQSLNIDFGQPPDQPSADYAAAGVPGYWNSILAAHGTTTFNLKDLNGNETSVELAQIGGTSILNIDDPLTSGDEDTMMDDFLVTYNPSLESCLFIRFLEPGWYELLQYAWMPSAPDTMSYTNCDEEPGNPHYEVGGAWPGGHQELVTYSRHLAQPDDVFLRIRGHSGIAPGADPALGAALNGIQLRKLEPGDSNGDQAVNIDDLLNVISAWGACPRPATGSCIGDVAPFPGGDGSVNIDDILEVLNHWG